MGVQNPNQRAAPKAATPKYSLPKNFKPEITTPAPPPRRGHAPTVFDTPLRNPIERMQTKQARSTARANLDVQKLEAPSIKADYGPAYVTHAVPHRPLTNGEVVHALNSAPGRDVTRQAFAELPAKKNGHGFNLTPAAIVHLPFAALADVPRELTGKGAAESAITALGTDAAKGWETVPGIGHFLGRAAKDAYSIPATALPSLYLPIREAVRGQVARLQGNPVGANQHFANAQHMVVSPIVNTLEHPIKSLSQHPVQTALIFRGFEGGLSRGAGAAGRSGLLGDAARAATNTKRIPLALAGNALEQRHYSKGLVEQLVQKAADKRAVANGRGTVTRVPVTDAEGKLQYTAKVPAIKASPRQLAQKNSVLPSSPLAGKLNRRVDLEYNKGVDIGRQRRDVATKFMRKQKPDNPDAVALVNEGVLKTGNEHRPMSTETVHEDLTNHLNELVAESHHLSDPADLAHNKANIAQVERLLADKKFLADPSHEIAAARSYAGAHAVQEAARVHHGDMSADQAERRILLPFAHRELGLEYDHEARHFVRPDEPLSAPKKETTNYTLTSFMLDETKKQLAVERLAEHDGRIRAITREIGKREYQLKNPSEFPNLTHDDLARIEDEQIRLEEDLHRAEQSKALDNVLNTVRDTRAIRQLPEIKDTPSTSRAVPTADIIKEFEQRGGNLQDLAYVPQSPGFRGAKNFGGSYHVRPPVEYRKFTGAANHGGLYERNYDTLTEQLAKASTRAARHESVTNLVNQFGVKQHNGDWFDYDSASREARSLAEATGEHYVPLSAARPAAPQSLVEDMHPAEAEEHFRTANPGDKHVVLFPATVADRLLEHDNVSANRVTGRSAIVTASRYFRHAVLPTSSKWLFGDAFEQYLRMQLNEPTPVHVAATIVAGKRYEARLAREYGQPHVENLRAAAGSGLFGSQRNIDIYDPNQGAYMNFIHTFRQSGIGPGKLIGPKGIGDLWDRYRDLVFSANRTITEGSAYYYALGKEARRDVSEMVSLWDRALGRAGPAYSDVIRGLTQSNNVARYAKVVDDLRGRYSNLSPTGRYFVATYTPFAPWYANAVHFIGALPVKHPVKTAVLADANEGTEQQRKTDGVPPWAGTSIPLSGGRYIPLEHYTPLGILEGEPKLSLRGVTHSVTGLVLPQESGVQMNSAGLTWYGSQLPKGANTDQVILNTALGTFVPVVARAQTILEKGNSAQPDSTIFHVKTKTQGGSYLAGLNKAFNPTRPQGGTGGPARAPAGRAHSGNRFLGSNSPGLPEAVPQKNRFLGG